MGSLVLAALLSVMLLVVAAAAELWLVLGLIPLVWLLPVPVFFLASVAYSKERYEIHDDHLVCHRGTVVSDGRTELDVRNITHVRLRLPWLRHRFFGIGDVRVESAGSGGSEITFESVVEPEAIYEAVLDRMRAHGFSLQKAETLHEESPGSLGAITDIVQVGIGGGFSLGFIGLFFVGILADVGLDSELAGVILGGLGLLGLLLTPVFGLAGLVVRYLDITRRTYTVYDDAVAYTEGFLTRDNAIIPFENIADAAVNRTFVDQVLGLYDVKVSCQGSGSEITFRRLSRGEELRAAIGTVVASAGKKARELDAKAREAAEQASETEGEADGAKPRRAAKPGRKRVDPDAAWTAELQMNATRAQVALLPLLPVFPAWIMAAIGMAIKVSKTTFTIGPNSMSSSYSFIGSNQQEFAYDKVTGVQVERNPLDGFFDTLSIQIWSIGSPQPLSMSHLSAADVDLPALLRQCGIDPSDEARGELRQSFGPQVWLVQNVFGLVFLALLILGLLVAAIFAPPVLLLIPLVAVLPLPAAIGTRMRVGKQRVTFHAEHLEAQTGIFFRKHVYARYDNVKKVEATRIPFTDQGKLKVYVAGEQIQQQQNGQQGAAIKVPYSLEGVYIEGITAKVDALDALMLGRIEPEQIDGEHAQGDDVISVSHPAVANAVVVLALVGLFFPPLWLGIPIVAWQTKVRTYSVETDRVVERGGILFKYAVSVLFDRIDSLQQNQGALGKAFGNGQVTILTAGSSTPDLVIANIPDYQDAYATIRKHYGKAVGS